MMNLHAIERLGEYVRSLNLENVHATKQNPRYNLYRSPQNGK